MVIDFPKNLGHLPDYESCKSFVYNKLVRNTVDKQVWEDLLLEACQKWPDAATYLHELATSKQRWGAPWRLEHFTCGYESSSPVEGSFSAFQRSIGPEPLTFVGVVQQHVRKDREKLQQEKVRTLREGINCLDPRTVAGRTDAANECANLFSSKTTEYFEQTNQDSQNYICTPISVSPSQSEQGATEAFEVTRRSIADTTNPPSPRTVMKINGVMRCGCKKDLNWGMPCDHIQCALQGGFVEQQFNNHWRNRDNVVEDPIVRQGHTTAANEEIVYDSGDVTFPTQSSQDSVDKTIVGNVDVGEENICNGARDGVGVFVTEYAPAGSQSIVKGNARAVQSKRRKKKLDHTQKYNMIVEEGKQIANIVSSDNEDLFYKALGVMRWLRSNIQNKSTKEIITASADYVGIELSSSSNWSDDVNSNDPEILPPLMKRGAGSTSTKRFRSGTEVTATKITKTTCKFCSLVGHYINKCPSANAIGCRLTKSNWVAEMGTVQILPKKNLPLQFDPVVPRDALGLQLIGCVFDGLRSQAQDPSKRIYCANVVMKGMILKDCRALWLTRAVIDEWAGKGKSSSHYVFVKKN